MGNRVPPSRLGKKQIIAFLRPNQIKAAYRKAMDEEKTNQEIIAEALNAVFQEHSLPPLLPIGHFRIVRRKQGKARMRDNETGPNCRAGTHAYAAWFDEDIVIRLKQFAAREGLPVQDIVEQGIAIITGVQGYRPDEN